MNHPDQAAWMAFLYGEVSSNRKRELHAHLDSCPACSAQIQTWRSSMRSLDAWQLPASPRKSVELAPILKWAAAAAVIMIIGFLLGRHTSSSASEVAQLKASMAQLADMVANQSGALSNSIAASTTAANAETVRLLTDYSRLQEEQRVTDREQVNLAFHAVDLRLKQIRSDLETVALSAETGFEEAHENITRVASLSLADKN